MTQKTSLPRQLAACALALCMGQAGAYPIDAEPETGIARLDGYLFAQDYKGFNQLPPGAKLTTEQIKLRLTEYPDLTPPVIDSLLTRKIVELLGRDARNYSVSVLDLSDPTRPLYAEYNAEVHRNPGSVGKILVALALFQALADVYPDDIAARKRVLKETQVTADAFILTDSHEVPFWIKEERRMPRRALRKGDTANLWTYLDWALSASSNAAASMVIKEVLLLRQFGKDYPPTPEQELAYFNTASAKQRSELLLDSLLTPLLRNGLNKDDLRQGSFFTAEGKRRVAGTNSTSTTRELLKYLLLMEQGKLVDEWSSLEIKRLLYMTQRRIRYASSPALSDAAVYFKSGSLFRCKPEPGFVCKKYHGNVDNWMNSVAIVESPAGEPRQFYLVALTSNVLKKNSAVEHQTFATRLHALLRDWPRAEPSAPADSE